MHILIDMQGAQTSASGQRGVGRYVNELVREFSKKNLEGFVFTLLFNSALCDDLSTIYSEYGNLFGENSIRFWHPEFEEISGNSFNSSARLAAENLRELVISQIGPDIVWAPNLQEGWSEPAATSVRNLESGAIWISTLHDLTPLEHPEIVLSKATYSWYHEKLKFARDSDFLLTVSEYSKNLISKHLGFDQDCIFFAHLGVDESKFNLKSASEWPHSLGAQSRYFLHAGGVEPHKNIKRLIEAFAIFEQQGANQVDLVFAGKHALEQKNDILRYAKKLKIRKNLVFVGQVSDAELARLMGNCVAFVMPSLAEGFGLPAIEAMSCGAPVLTSNTSALNELNVSPMAKFNPFSSEEIARALIRIGSDTDIRNAIIDEQRIYLGKFTWKSSANELIEFFSRAFSQKIQTDVNIEVDLFLQEYKELYKSVGSQFSALSISKSLALIAPQTPTVFIDVSSVINFDWLSGIQRVVKEMAYHLVSSPNIRVVPIWSYPGENIFWEAEINFGGVAADKFIKTDKIAAIQAHDVIFFPDLHPSNVISKQKLLKSFKRAGVRLEFLIHDILPIISPEFFHPDVVEEFSRYIGVTREIATGVLFTTTHVQKSFSTIQDKSLAPIKIPSKVIGLGFDFQAARRLQSSRPAMESKNIQFLMVGTLEPRKGHGDVLDAFEAAWACGETWELRIVGRLGWLSDELNLRIQDLIRRGFPLFYLGQVSDSQLQHEYELATCLIAASFDEGFGLPLIEARSAGVPLFVRDIPVFREVAGKFATYSGFENATSVYLDLKNWVSKNIPVSENGKLGNLDLGSTWSAVAKLALEHLLRHY